MAGDPDESLQIVHQLLSPSVEIRAILCSHDHEVDRRDSAAEVLLVMRDAFRRMWLLTHICCTEERAFPSWMRAPLASAAAEAILAEAARDDDRPPVRAAGAGSPGLALA